MMVKLRIRKHILHCVILCTIFLTAQLLSQPKTYYVATDGSDSNTGLSIDQPFATAAKACTTMVAGDTTYVRGGTYICTVVIRPSVIGTDSTMKTCLFAYPGERPLLDFSSMGTPNVSGNNDGIRLTGKYWYIKGLYIKGAQHNGIQINGGNNNIIEFCTVYENRNTGLQLSTGASYNRIINCDSYYNRDSTSASYDGEADGFAPKLDVGTGNYFYGCRSWQNSDDGWDGYLRPADNVFTTLENCWCFKNGYKKNGFFSTGNGNGFKMGGGDGSNADSLRHNMILKNCLSFVNLRKGFDQNNNRGSMTMINCTGYKNGSQNFSVSSFIRTGETLTLKNCISFASTVSLSGVPDPVLATNSWPDTPPYNTVATNADFVSIDSAGVRGQRKADGSLPDITFMHLASGSQFINSGTDVGLAFNGTAPDLGCFESDYPAGVDDQNEVRITGFNLLQNFPNPFNPSTAIRFSVAKQSVVKLKVLNILGQEIAVLFSGRVEPGKIHSVSFNGELLSSGIYFSVLESSGEKQIRKMVLLR